MLNNVVGGAKALLGGLLGPFEKEGAFEETTAVVTGESCSGTFYCSMSHNMYCHCSAVKSNAASADKCTCLNVLALHVLGGTAKLGGSPGCRHESHHLAM